jgi:hypothetical protein
MDHGIYQDGEIIAKFTTPITIKSNKPVTVSDTLSLKRYVSSSSAQRWEIEAGLEPLSLDANDLMVNLITSGHETGVQVVVPQNYGVYRRNTGSGTVTASGSADSDTVTISGLTGTLHKGTFIKFANHNKLYMLKENSTSTTLKVYPELRSALSSTGVSYSNNVIVEFYYDTDVVTGMIYSDGILMDLGTIRLVEKL